MSLITGGLGGISIVDTEKFIIIDQELEFSISIDSHNFEIYEEIIEFEIRN